MATNTSSKTGGTEPKTRGAGIDIPCCPEIVDQPCSDKLRFRYRLPFNPLTDNNRVPVSVTLVFEYERCTLGLTQGDIQNSFSLLPGEQVRLFTSDKSSRWSYDRETSLAYRHERTSSESHLSFGFAKAVSDLNIAENASVTSSFDESWAEGGGGASLNLGIVEIGGGGGGGSYSASASRQFARNLSRHAESSSSYVAASVRASRAVSMGEVETREHAEGESEQHFEASTRRIHNENRCHAVNYFVWQLMKRQRIRWRLVAIDVDVRDPVAPTEVARNPRFDNKLSVTPQAVLATDKRAVELQSVELNRQAASLATASFTATAATTHRFGAGVSVDTAVRDAALTAVRAELQREGLIDKDGSPQKTIVAELSWEREELIPTSGLVVKGCLDTCSVCEDSREKEIEIGIENARLRNELLKKKIELLDKHRDYRCCPEGEAETS